MINCFFVGIVVVVVVADGDAVVSVAPVRVDDDIVDGDDERGDDEPVDL
jgi:hypothetical protein